MRSTSILYSFSLAVVLAGLPSIGAFAADTADENAAEAPTPKEHKKAKKAGDPAEEHAAAEATAQTQAGETGGSAEHKSDQAIVRSQTSLSLEDRLMLGTSAGWGYVKPKVGKWQGIGMSSFDGAWRKSPKPDGKLYITARYTPYSGVWTVDNRDYDTTAHGFFAGAKWLLPFAPGSADLKAGVELGYLMVYARPQDEAEADGQVKGGKVAAGGSVEMNWTVLSKMKIGPIVRLSGGGFSNAFLGAAANFVF